MPLIHRMKYVGWRTYNVFVCGAAFLWRTLLFRTTFIAVTGSLGKTTAKECLAAILASQGPTVKTFRNNNGRHGVPRTILRARPWDRYVVIEIGTDRPGNMIRGAFLIRPDVAVILGVARTHTREFRSLERTAVDKAKLLRFLRRGGVAVLNGEDERVAAMASSVRGRVVRFGSSPEFDVWATDASSAWPSRLEFRLCSADGSYPVQTQLVGTHWIPSVLGAVAAAKACGVSLAQAAQALGSVPPFPGRMQPAPLPNGAIVLRDDYNGSIDSLEAACEVMRSARAGRKVLVISDCSDFGKNYRHRHRHIAALAREMADLAVFVGSKSTFTAKHALRLGMPPATVQSFLTLASAVGFLERELRPGDLILLRGRSSDHVTRLYFAQLGQIDCWMMPCGSRGSCEYCPKLGFRPATRIAHPPTREADRS